MFDGAMELPVQNGSRLGKVETVAAHSHHPQLSNIDGIINVRRLESNGKRTPSSKLMMVG